MLIRVALPCRRKSNACLGNITIQPATDKMQGLGLDILVDLKIGVRGQPFTITIEAVMGFRGEAIPLKEDRLQIIDSFILPTRQFSLQRCKLGTQIIVAVKTLQCHGTPQLF